MPVGLVGAEVLEPVSPAPRLGRRAVVEAQLDRTLPGAVDDAGQRVRPDPATTMLRSHDDLGEQEAFSVVVRQKLPDDEIGLEDHFPDTSWQSESVSGALQIEAVLQQALDGGIVEASVVEWPAVAGNEDRPHRSRVVQTLRPR